ncbi:hypothetical protein V6Z12_D12G190000 [Gossypium hirsutum]
MEGLLQAGYSYFYYKCRSEKASELSLMLRLRWREQGFGLKVVAGASPYGGADVACRGVARGAREAEGKRRLKLKAVEG